MAFWSGDTLRQRMPALVDPYDESRIDCAAYTLCLGSEVYVTANQSLSDSAKSGTKLPLDSGEQIRIPPGQFAFLLTEEVVQVPSNALAFISVKAQYKFKGLVNVSGFHVDPGWKGKLIFSVYNAGPASVVLSRGTRLFLLWYADLDTDTEKYKKDGVSRFDALPDSLVNNMGGQVFSPMALSQEVESLWQTSVSVKEDFSDRTSALRLELAQLKGAHDNLHRLFWTVFIGGVVLAAAKPFFTQLFSEDRPSEAPRISVERPTAEGTVDPRSAPPLKSLVKPSEPSKSTKGSDSPKKQPLRTD